MSKKNIVKTMLYILPHAGGAAYTYQALANALGNDDVEVCCLDLPGHGSRARERCLTDMEALAGNLLNSIELHNNQPWILFGHSMGAILAYAICHECRKRGRSVPEHLFLSGTAAPGYQKHSGSAANLPSKLPSKAFWEKISGYGGVPEEILRTPELMNYFEDILRHDFQAVEGYKPSHVPVSTPITIFYGQDDMAAEDAHSWQAETDGIFQVQAFAGGHFFLFEAAREISRCIHGNLIEQVPM